MYSLTADVVTKVLRRCRTGHIVAALVAIVFAGCGGGGGGGTPQPPPPPINSPIGAVTDANPAVNEIAENTGADSLVGLTAQATDSDAGDTVSFSLSDDAGGLFAIDGSTGVVTISQPLDFEAGASWSITVQASSSDGSSNSASFTIDVLDISPVVNPIFPVAGLTDEAIVDVRFSAQGTGGSSIASAAVVVNGTQIPAQQGVDDTWRLNAVSLVPGANTIALVATDDGGEITSLNLGTVRFEDIVSISRALAVDATTDTAYVIDDVTWSIKAVNLANGTVGVVSDASRGSGPSLIAPLGLAIDEAGNRLFVTTRQRIYEVSIATGNRTLLFELPPNTVDSGRLAAWDPTRNLLMVGSCISGGDISCIRFFDPVAGAYNNALALNPALLDPRLDAIRGVAVDPTDGGVYIFDAADQKIVSGIPETATFSVVTGDGVGSGVDFLDIGFGTFDVVGDRLITFDTGSSSVVAVDKTSGARTTLSDAGTGSGDLFGRVPRGIGVAGVGVVVLEQGAVGVRLIDDTTGNRSVVHDSSVGDGVALTDLKGVFFDPEQSRAVILDASGKLISADYVTGQRTTLFDSASMTSSTFSNPSSMVFDSANRIAIVHSLETDNIVELNVDTGGVNDVAFDIGGDNPLVLHRPLAMSIDVAGQRLFYGRNRNSLDINSWDLTVRPVTALAQVINDSDFSLGLGIPPTQLENNNLTYDSVTERLRIIDQDVFDLRVLSADTTSPDVAIDADDIAVGFNIVDVLQPALDRDLLFVPVDGAVDAPSLVTVNLDDGLSNPVSTYGSQGSGPAVFRPIAVSVAESGQSVLLLDSPGTLLMVDIESGNRIIIAR